MSPLLEMSLKSPPAPVTIISTYLTFEFLQFTKNTKFISNFIKHSTPQKLIHFINWLLHVCCKEQLQVEVTLALNKTRAQLPFTSTGAMDSSKLQWHDMENRNTHLAKAMEFVKPVRDGLAIPTHRQLQWVINSLLIIFTLTFCSYFLLRIKPSTTSAHTLPPTVHKLTVLTIWI